MLSRLAGVVLLTTMGLVILVHRDSACASPLRIEKIVGEVAKDGLLHSRVTVRLEGSKVPGKSMDVKRTVTCIGQPMGDTGDEFTTNRKGTIGALAFQPATKICMTVLFVALSKNSITVISDFNHQIAKLLKRLGKHINEEYVVVHKISANKLTLYSYSYDEAEYRIQIQVLPTGRMKLLAYSASKVQHS